MLERSFFNVIGIDQDFLMNENSGMLYANFFKSKN